MYNISPYAVGKGSPNGSASVCIIIIKALPQVCWGQLHISCFSIFPDFMSELWQKFYAGCQPTWCIPPLSGLRTGCYNKMAESLYQYHNHVLLKLSVTDCSCWCSPPLTAKNKCTVSWGPGISLGLSFVHFVSILATCPCSLGGLVCCVICTRKWYGYHALGKWSLFTCVCIKKNSEYFTDICILMNVIHAGK